MAGRSAWSVMVLSAVLLVSSACSAAQPSVAPSSGNGDAGVGASGSPRPAASPSSRPTPEASPTDAPTAASTETPEPTAEPVAEPAEPPASLPDGPLVVDWDVADIRGLERLTGIRGDAALGDSRVIAGEYEVATEDGDLRQVGGIWRSDDGGTWEMVLELDQGWVSDVTAGGPGFVAVGIAEAGAAVWVSSDGRTWRRVEDDAFRRGRMFHVAVSDGGIVAFGEAGESDAGVIWTSADGASWLKATNASGLAVAAGLQALVADDGRLTAFVGEWDRSGPVEIWTTTGRAEWDKVGTLPKSGEASISSAAHGPRGWVAIGDLPGFGPGAAWRSDDGVNWQRVAGAPDTARALIADESGFVAAGFIGGMPGETCGDPRDFQAQTWTATDGRAWRLMRTDASFRRAHVESLFRSDRTLTGIGLQHDDGGRFESIAWTADLPSASDDDEAPSAPSAKEQGCGD